MARTLDAPIGVDPLSCSNSDQGMPVSIRAAGIIAASIRSSRSALSRTARTCSAADRIAASVATCGPRMASSLTAFARMSAA